MNIDPRYIFNASAFAIGGRLQEPYLCDFKVQAPTTLPTVGGVSVAEAAPSCWVDLLSFDSARSMVRGGGPPPYERVTTASAEVTNVEVEGRLKVGRVKISIRSHDEPDDEQPSIVPEETEISGVSVDGCRLTVELDSSPFQEMPTKRDIVRAYRDPDWRKRFGGQFLHSEKEQWDDQLEEYHGGLILATIVKGISVEHTAGCRRHGGDIVIDGNTVVVPNFGRIYFGELIIADSYRRFNAFRLKLGSPAKGNLEFAGVGSNGGGVP